MPAITLNLLDSAGSPALTKVLSFKAFDGSVLSATAGTDSFSATLAPQTYRVLIDGVDSGVDYTPRFDSAPATMPAHLGGGYYLMAHPRSITIDKRVTQPGSHTHIIGDVTGLQVALDGKASLTHNHQSITHIGPVGSAYSTNTSTSLSTNRNTYAGNNQNAFASAYVNGYPSSFGNTWQSCQNGFGTELFIGASGGTSSGQTAQNGMWFRNLADWGSTWSNWAQVWTDANFNPSIKVDKVTGRQLMPDPNGDSKYVLNGAGNWFQALGNDGLIRPELMPPLAVQDTYTVNTQAAMLALSCQKGDICVRTDAGATYILASEPASSIANWTQILTPADGVQSVNGKSGASLSLDHADIYNLNANSSYLHVTSAEKTTWNGKADSGHTHSIASVSGLQSALDGKFQLNTAVSSDVNNATRGIWRMNTGLTNQPAGTDWGTLVCFANYSDTGFQLASDFTSSNFYWRSGNGPTFGGAGSFGPWRGIWHTGNFDPSTKVDASTLNSYRTATAQDTALTNKSYSLNLNSCKVQDIDVSLSNHNHYSVYAETGAKTLDFNILTSSTYLGSVYTGTNTPNGGTAWWNVLNIRHRGGALDGNNYGLQIATGMTDYENTFSYRTHKSGTWSGWKDIWHTGNFDPSTKANTSHNHDAAYVAKGGASPTTNFTQGVGGFSAAGTFYGTVNTMQVQVNNGLKCLKIDITTTSTGLMGRSLTGTPQTAVIGTITNWASLYGSTACGVIHRTRTPYSSEPGHYANANIVIDTDGVVYLHTPYYISGVYYLPSCSYQATILLI